jgi:hypothetical protein
MAESHSMLVRDVADSHVQIDVVPIHPDVAGRRRPFDPGDPILGFAMLLDPFYELRRAVAGLFESPIARALRTLPGPCCAKFDERWDFSTPWDVEVEQAFLVDNAPRFVSSCELQHVENVPMTEEMFGPLIDARHREVFARSRPELARRPPPSHDSLATLKWLDALIDQTARRASEPPESAADSIARWDRLHHALPRASYVVRTTAPDWTQHVKPGLSWDGVGAQRW